MPRRNRWPGGVLLLVAGAALSLAPAPEATPAQGPRQVNVTMTCPADLETQGITVTVRPWIQSVEPGDTLRWNLAGAGGAQTMTLTSGNWPLPSPLTGTPDIEAVVPPDAPAGDYTYAIELECRGTRVVIDPGMRIGG